MHTLFTFPLPKKPVQIELPLFNNVYSVLPHQGQETDTSFAFDSEKASGMYVLRISFALSEFPVESLGGALNSFTNFVSVHTSNQSVHPEA